MPVWCNKAAEASLVAGRSAAHGPCREPHPSPVSGGRRAAPLSHRQRRSLSVGIVGWPGTSDHVGPVGLHRPPRPCDAQDPGGGRSEPVLRGDTVRGAAVRAGWGRPPRSVAGACCAREATSWSPASSSSCSLMMLSRSKMTRVLWPVRSMATRSGTLARMRLRAAVQRQSWRKRVGTPAA